MELLARTWLIMASLPRSWLAFARSCMAMASLPRSWQGHGKILARLSTNLPWILARMPWFRTLGCDEISDDEFSDDEISGNRLL